MSLLKSVDRIAKGHGFVVTTHGRLIRIKQQAAVRKLISAAAPRLWKEFSPNLKSSVVNDLCSEDALPEISAALVSKTAAISEAKRKGLYRSYEKKDRKAFLVMRSAARARTIWAFISTGRDIRNCRYTANRRACKMFRRLYGTTWQEAKAQHDAENA